MKKEGSPRAAQSGANHQTKGDLESCRNLPFCTQFSVARERGEEEFDEEEEEDEVEEGRRRRRRRRARSMDSRGYSN